MTPIKTASDLALVLKRVMDERFNVSLVVKHPATEKTEYLYVHFLNFHAASKTLVLSALRSEDAKLQSMLDVLTRTEAIYGNTIQISMPENSTVYRIVGISEQRTYRDKFGEHDGVVLVIESL